MPVVSKLELRDQIFTATLEGQVLTFSITPIASGAASSSLFTPPQPSTTIEVAVHATDLTSLSMLPKLENADFLAFISATLEKHAGAKRLMATAPENVDALKAQGYDVCNPADKILIPYQQLRHNLKLLASKHETRAKHFAAYQEKLTSGEWLFIAGSGSELIGKINIDKLLEFYTKHCPFSAGGFKTELKTYDREAMAARFFYPGSAVMSFAIVSAATGDIIAANHLLFTGKQNNTVGYCYDNVVATAYRSQHLYQFFLKQIDETLEKLHKEPASLVIIMGAQGQEGNGLQLKQLLIGNSSTSGSSQTLVLMFKGSAPGPMIIAAIQDEKNLAMQGFEVKKKTQLTA